MRRSQKSSEARTFPNDNGGAGIGRLPKSKVIPLKSSAFDDHDQALRSIFGNPIVDPGANELRFPPVNIINKKLCEKSFTNYVKQAWHVIEPGTELMWNWHIDAIGEHLMAVTKKEISFLLINIPPREMKSILVSVMFPTWEWGPAGFPHYRYVCSSYDIGLSIRDALKSRRIMASTWYQSMWGDRFKITSDQNQKQRYENDKTGFRIATSVRGMGTGEGGDRIIVDDPHNVTKAESDSERRATHTWWDESMSTRVNQELTGAYIMICQRTHADDLAGHWVEKLEGEKINLVKLILPARFEKERELKLQTKTPLPFKDPRKEEGEPLNKSRAGDEALKQRRAKMTQYSWDGQMQQRPHARGGNLFEVAKMKIVDRLPAAIKRVIRYWDKAATEDVTAPRTAGVKMAQLIDDTFIILHVKKGQWSAGRRNAIIKTTARLDGLETVIWVEQEPGSGGKESAEISVKDLAGYKVHTERVSGQKEDRAEAYASAIENGLVHVMKAEWTQEFLDEHETAPTGKFKDQWDAAAGAFNKLAGGHKKVGTW